MVHIYTVRKHRPQCPRSFYSLFFSVLNFQILASHWYLHESYYSPRLHFNSKKPNVKKANVFAFHCLLMRWKNFTQFASPLFDKLFKKLSPLVTSQTLFIVEIILHRFKCVV